MKSTRSHILGSTVFGIFILFSVLFFSPNISLASSVYIGPATGTFSVGDTFTASVLLDTQGKSINALQIFLTFPPDKLQVVSPSTGQSVVDVWTVPPKYNNAQGTVDLEGGIPGGIVTSKGVLTNITFRVKTVGESVIRILDKSKVYLNDGLATNNLGATENAVYELKLPPPRGPLVASDTHFDQSTWYPDNNVILRFVNTYPVGGYSYILSKEPDSVPDNISEGTQTSVAYNNLGDGLYYFNIKALRDGVWGGVTHFAIRIDTTPPAAFPIDILPSARTTSTTPVIQFDTTDINSGLDHYEIKIEPLSQGAITAEGSGEQNFFVETTSPYISSPLAIGEYNVVIRAYDKATNYTETSKKLTITTPLFRFIGDTGIVINNSLIIPWKWVWVFGIFLLFVLAFFAYKVFFWHREVHILTEEKMLPQDVVQKLEELKKYREKYGVKTLVALFAILSMFSFRSVHAETLVLTPPLITDYSKDISNKDIFYAGGKTDITKEDIILYIENLSTGATLSEELQSDDKGNWFYRHDTFLTPGSYVLWVQSKQDDQLSPPGPQAQMTVKRTAITFGQNRLSYETIYLFLVILLLIAVIVLALWIAYHAHHGRKKHKKFQTEVRDAEESIRRGFAVLKHDIESELAVVRRAQLPESLSGEERDREAQLLADLNSIAKHIGKEIWEMGQEDL